MVALLRMGRRPWVDYAELVEERGSALAVLEDEFAEHPDRPGQQTLLLGEERPDTRTLMQAAQQDLDRWDAAGMQLVTVLDPAYPTNLRAVHDRPPIVFLAGRLTPADGNGIAVVGARKATPQGIASARTIATHLTDRGYTVVSGLAAGIDTAAHTAALANNGRTVAVIGTGLARCYPPQNATLQRRIATECAVISQFWPDAPPTRRSFPMRNAVMSGFSLATVVVEASDTSGARMQARLALAQGRPVFLPASLVERQTWAKEYASRPGTHVVRDATDITTVLERLIAPGSLVA